MTAYVPDDPIDFRMGQKRDESDIPSPEKHKKYTITSNYSATGEGHTITICYIMADSPESALKEFERLVHGGDWFVKGAQISEDWDFLGEEARILVTPAVQKQLEDEKCYQTFTATMYYNYS